MKSIRIMACAALFATIAVLNVPAKAQTPNLGSAQSFAVLGSTTVTNTGASSVSGNLGVNPGTAITGFPPGTMPRGVIYAGGSVATQAAGELATAYTDIAGRAYLPANDLSGRDLGGLKLSPGVYHFNTAAQLSSSLTLDAKGDPNAVFIFQIGTTLTTASNSFVKIIGGGNSDNVYWQVGSSATLGTGTVFQGNILAYTSVTLTTNAGVLGRLLAKNGAVTLDTNSVANSHWTAASIAAGPNGTKRVLWYNTDGSASYWTVDAGGNRINSHAYGPFPDWTARHIAVGPDGMSRILWNNRDGRMSLWTVDSNGGYTNTPAYGPYSGWSATGLAVGPDNKARVMWTNTSGIMSLWTIDSGGGYTNTPAYGPYSGWSATSLAVGPDNKARVLWTNTAGVMSLWTIDGSSNFTNTPAYGPFSGWNAKDVSVGPDGMARILWNHDDGRASLWSIDGSNNYTTTSVYGPFGGWYAAGLSVGPDNTAHLVWNVADGRMSLWEISGSGNATSSGTFGPFTN